MVYKAFSSPLIQFLEAFHDFLSQIATIFILAAADSWHSMRWKYFSHTLYWSWLFLVGGQSWLWILSEIWCLLEPASIREVSFTPIQLAIRIWWYHEIFLCASALIFRVVHVYFCAWSNTWTTRWHVFWTVSVTIRHWWKVLWPLTPFLSLKQFSEIGLTIGLPWAYVVDIGWAFELAACARGDVALSSHRLTLPVDKHGRLQSLLLNWGRRQSSFHHLERLHLAVLTFLFWGNFATVTLLGLLLADPFEQRIRLPFLELGIRVLLIRLVLCEHRHHVQGVIYLTELLWLKHHLLCATLIAIVWGLLLVLRPFSLLNRSLHGLVVSRILGRVHVVSDVR